MITYRALQHSLSGPGMSLNLEQVGRLARLSRIEISASDSGETLDQLNGIFALIEQLQAADTTGIAPMAHAVELCQRLREDVVTEIDRHQAFQALAPEVEEALYLVPKVME